MNDQHQHAPNEPSPSAPPPLPPVPPAPPVSNRAGTAGKRFWIPAVAGAVAASVVWGAAVALTGGFGGSDDGAPDARGYRSGMNLCEEQSTKALERLYSLKSPDSAVLRHPNMDRSECHRDLEGKGADGDGSTMVSTTFTLHKKGDPAPAYIAESEGADYLPKSKTSVKKISGLGERAYFVQSDMEYGHFLTLSVLDGGAVYAVRVTSPRKGEGPGVDKVERALVEDARATLAALKRS